MFPFVLIFVIVAGAIILFFFFGFAKDILRQGESLNDLEIVNLLDRKLDSFTLAKNAINTFDVPGRPEIEITCFEDFGKKKTRIQIKDAKYGTYKMIATPSLLKEKKITAWTLAWEYPFKIDNLYYLANDKVKFYFQGISGDLANVFNNLPSQFKKFPSINFDLDKNEKNVIVYFNEADARNSRYRDFAKVIFLDVASNKIIFFDNRNEVPEQFWGFPMIYAAIFAENAQEYKCLKEIAHKRLKTISEIYKQKAHYLQGKNIECEPIYSQIYAHLSNNDFLNKPLELGYESKLMRLNRELNGKNCPVLF